MLDRFGCAVAILVVLAAVDGPGRREELLRHCVAAGPAKKWRRAPERERSGS